MAHLGQLPSDLECLVRSLATLRRVRNDAPVPLAASRGSAAGIGGGSGASATDLLGKMGAVPTLFSVVNRTSTATAALDWHLYRVPTDGRSDPGEDREEITTKHAAVDLWRDPNPFMSTADLVETCQQHMDLVGETIMVVTKMGKIPVELWPVRPDRMTPVTDPTKFLVGWIYKDPDGGKIPLNAEDVIQIKMPNPSDPYRGLGPVQALLADLDSMRYSSEWSRNFFLNSAEPGGIIELPTHLSDTQWDEFTTRWQEQHRGVNRAHRVAVVEYGGKYVPRGFSMRDLMFPELRTMGRDTVYEAFGVSLATMGVTEGVNYAAAKAARTQFAELLTVPRANRWRGALNRQLLPMFEPAAAKRKPGQPVKRTVEFDYDSPVQGDDESENSERLAKANAASIYITAGFDPVSVAEALGLPDMQYGTEEDDPDRNLMLSLIKAAPAALAPTLLPILLPNVEGLADALAPPPPPGLGGPAIGSDGKPVPPEDAPPGMDKGAAPPPDGAAPGKPFPGAKDAASAAVRLASAAELDELDAAWQEALDQAMAQWGDITAAQREELRAQVIAAVDNDDLGALATMTVASAAAAAVLLALLLALARKAGAQVVAGNPDIALTATIEEGELGGVAAAVAALLASELALAAGREALRVAGRGEPGSQVASEVDEALRQRSDASVRAQVGGALTGAANRARVDTMASGPVGSIYADETLDGNTCAPCRAHHGRFVCTTDDLGPYDRIYTSMGGYVDCLGGVRCRGTVTGVWRPATTSEPLIPAGRELPYSSAGVARFPGADWSEDEHPRDPDGKFHRNWSGADLAEDYRAHVKPSKRERAAVDVYTGPAYEMINGWLRSGNAIVVNGVNEDPRWPVQEEVILPRGTRYVVDELPTRDQRGRLVVKMTAIPPDPTSPVATAVARYLAQTWKEEHHPRDPDGKFRRGMSMQAVIDDYRERVHKASERSERRVVSDYCGNEFAGINGWLRAGADPNAFDGPDRQEQVREMDRLMGRYELPKDLTVYRFMYDDSVPAQQQAPGTIIEPRGYSSATLNAEIGETDKPGYGFAKRPVAMKINVPKGSNLVIPEGIGVGIEYEKEAILPHGMRYVVVSDERGDDGKRYIEMDAVPPGSDHPDAGIPAIEVPPLLSGPAREDLAQSWADEVGPLDATEQAALTRYRSMTGHMLMNGLLRGKNMGLDEDQQRTIRHELAALDNLAGSYQIPEAMTVRRFVDAGVVPDDAAPGVVIAPRGMHSTTMAPSPGDAWDRSGTVMEIVVPQGSPAIVAGGRENELILPHETQFAIAKIEQREGKQWVTMTAIPPEHLV